jgi:hypothetical protein
MQFCTISTLIFLLFLRGGNRKSAEQERERERVCGVGASGTNFAGVSYVKRANLIKFGPVTA